MTIKVKIRPFDVPDHVYAESQYAGLKQDGLVENPKWTLPELDEETLSELCDKFRDDVFAKSGKKDTLKVT